MGTERIHFMDGLRAVLMLWGIPFHSAVYLDRLFGHDSGWLTAFRDFSHIWRMPTFFVIAGFFAVVVLRKRGAISWYCNRLTRLGVPLLFGVILINPLQMLILSSAATETWVDTIARWKGLMGTVGPQWLYHLWFLLYLLIYCLILTAFTPALRKVRAPVSYCLDFIDRSSATRALALFLTALAVIVGIALWQIFGIREKTGRMLDSGLVSYFPFFLAGVALASRKAYLGNLIRAKRLTVFSLALVTALLIVCRDFLPLPDSRAVGAMFVGIHVVSSFSWAVLLFWLAEKAFSRRSKTVEWLVDASLVVYIVHHPVIYLLGEGIVSVAISPLLAFAALVFLTTLFSFTVYEITNRVKPLRFLMNGHTKTGTKLTDVLALRAVQTKRA